MGFLLRLRSVEIRPALSDSPESDNGPHGSFTHLWRGPSGRCQAQELGVSAGPELARFLQQCTGQLAAAADCVRLSGGRNMVLHGSLTQPQHLSDAPVAEPPDHQDAHFALPTAQQASDDDRGGANRLSTLRTCQEAVRTDTPSRLAITASLHPSTSSTATSDSRWVSGREDARMSARFPRSRACAASIRISGAYLASSAWRGVPRSSTASPVSIAAMSRVRWAPVAKYVSVASERS